MERGTVIGGTVGTPPPGRHERSDPDPPRDPVRDPWTPSSGRDLLAGVAVIAVLLAILVVYTQDVPRAPRPSSSDPAPWAQSSPPQDAPTNWAAVPVRQLPDLDPSLRNAIGARLAKARAAIARCVGEAGGSRSAHHRPAELVLRLAPRSGALHVEGIEASASGAPPEEVVDCARRVLDGDAIPSPGVVPGRRYRLLVALE